MNNFIWLLIKNFNPKIIAAKVLMMCIFAFLFYSCGYKPQIADKLPHDISTVLVTLFKNKTSQIGAEIIFTNALIEEFMQNSSVRVVSQGFPEKEIGKDIPNNDIYTVDAVIQGKIVSISFDALARTTDDVVYKRGVNAVISLELKSKNGDVLFSVENFAERESYAVTHDNSIDEAVVKITLEKLARRISRKIVNLMTDDF